MRDRDLAVIGGERAGHRGGGVALDDDHVGLLGVHHIAEPGEQARGEAVEILAGLHQIEIDIGDEPGDGEHLIEQAAMLGGDAGPHDEAGHLLERGDDGEQLDRLGPGAEDDEDGVRG